ncbi:metallo-beta-lactamase family protein (macronuclear) [Tetrahymena thermophila SB210]|uniref:Metallo-beta-lactamase family protein n=1 Tax=Tetrahymena thermophila (strain SB210) TaxID=312017 RepID=Q236K6_TETTS|nr:metallo-beta-lactamase family protein [Tetrahymena thermophila SB210]EAR92494.1 metallo-beta-lactamase family protein [Tetrahymena thermophila SB210]|eukprot:XP_001012739.1 metallo-beta-lactamase family protein [Tetrahymena thermophila SB210]
MGCSSSQVQVVPVIQEKIQEAQIFIEENQNFHICQFFTSFLSQISYYIESEKQAILIDPLRDIQQYIEYSQKREAKITHVFLTDFHSDFIGGHVDIQKQADAQIVLGPTSIADFEFHQAKDNEIISIGKIKMQVLYTPGHTNESTCFLLLDDERQHAIFTGDTLYLEEASFPNLAATSEQIDRSELAGHLFDSLRNKIIVLDPTLIIYPGHVTGNSRINTIQKNKNFQGVFDTLLNQIQTNASLTKTDRELFKESISGLTYVPEYYFNNIYQNQLSIQPIKEIVDKSLVFIPPNQFLQEISKYQDCFLIDTRSPEAFQELRIPYSINLFEWLSLDVKMRAKLQPSSKLFIISECGKERYSITLLALIGYEHILGCLEGGFEAFQKSHKIYGQIASIKSQHLSKDMHFLDLREEEDFQKHHIKGAYNIPINTITIATQHDSQPLALPRNKIIYVYSNASNRSLAGCCLLNESSYYNIVHVDDSYSAIKKNKKLEFKSGS